MWKIAMLGGPPACLVSHQTEGPLGKVLRRRTSCMFGFLSDRRSIRRVSPVERSDLRAVPPGSSADHHQWSGTARQVSSHLRVLVTHLLLCPLPPPPTPSNLLLSFLPPSPHFLVLCSLPKILIIYIVLFMLGWHLWGSDKLNAGEFTRSINTFTVWQNERIILNQQGLPWE